MSKCLFWIQKYVLVDDNVMKPGEYFCNGLLPRDKKNKHGSRVDRKADKLSLFFTATQPPKYCAAK